MGNKFEENLNQNTNIFIHENEFENAICLERNVLTLHLNLTGLIQGLHPSNEKRRYEVTPTPIG